MARVIYGGGISEFVGSIGGTTYQSNGSGFIARQLPKIPKSRTTDQVNQILKFTYYSQLYRNLSGSDRASWEAFSIANTHTNLWGKTSTVNGLSWFIIINSQLVSQGNTIINTAPTYSAPILCEPFTLTIGSGSLVLSTASTFAPSGYTMMFCFLPPLRSATIIPRKSAIIYIPNYVADVGSVNIGVDWETVTSFNIADDINDGNNVTSFGISIVDDDCPIPSPFVFNT